MRNKILSLLVLLLTAATGAWANDAYYTLDTSDENNKTGNSDYASSGSVTVDGISWTFEGNGAVNPWRIGGNSITNTNRAAYTQTAMGAEIASVDLTVGAAGADITVNSLKLIVASDAAFTTVIDEVSGTYETYSTITFTPTTGDRWAKDAYYKFVFNVTVSGSSNRVVEFSKVEFYEYSIVTINDAKNEATFAMPAFDATAEYELVRDLATSTKVDLIIGTGSDAVTATADTRLRIAKSNNVYAPISALSCNFVDQIENTTIAATAFADAKLTPQFYLQGENDAWTLVTDINTTTHLPNGLLPGQVYCITLKAADGSYYDGETQPSYTVTLFEGYEVTVPAGEFVTFYKDENIYEADDDAELYTISSVSDNKVMLSDVRDLIPANTAMLVYNKSTEEKTFLLIPTEDEPVSFMSYGGFKGTLTGTTIAASSASQNNYALNGTAFVWVKNSIAVGANKCWLEVPTGVLAARRLTITFGDGNTTGIDAIDNGQLIMDDGDWYDLNGRKLNKKPTKKGVYIQNGQKVVIK